MATNNPKETVNAKDFCYTASDKKYLATLEKDREVINASLAQGNLHDYNATAAKVTGTVGGAIVGSAEFPIGTIIGGAIGYVVAGAATTDKDELNDKLTYVNSKIDPIHASCQLLVNTLEHKVDAKHWPAIQLALNNEELKIIANSITEPAQVSNKLNESRVKLATCLDQIYEHKNTNDATCPISEQALLGVQNELNQ